MARLCLVIEYDGSNYGGWQVQPNAVTVQQRLEEALAQVVGEPVRLYSSGRTDAGVHSLGMCAHVDVNSLLALSAYREGVNRLLPDDIAVVQAVQVDDTFHARFSACGKWYQYRIHRSRIRSPLLHQRAWQLGCALDTDAMRAAAQLLEGEHDFAAFRSSSCASTTTVRTIFSVAIREHGRMLLFDVRGSGFLKNMVRIIVGTLVDVGRARLSVADVAALLNDGERRRAGQTAPACGLYLMAVNYPDGVFTGADSGPA